MKIALTQRVLLHKGRLYDSIEHGWYQYLKGHRLFFVPNNPDQDFATLAFQTDVLILTGGDDSAVRRVTETRLANAMLKLRKPIVGVCHGSFLLTDILGASMVPCDGHMDVEHTITYRSTEILVNSFHTQTIDSLHHSGVCLATDKDGHVEAWIDGNIAGVNWHPQRMTRPWLPKEINDLIQG